MNNFIATCRRALGVLAFLFLGTAGAHASALPDEAEMPQVHARIVAAVDAVHPGEQVLLGIEQRIQPHWHTYWVNPGDSGVATRIAWDLPAGASAGNIQWPVPSRFQSGPVTSYGYENEVTLLSTISVPANAKAGSTFPVKAKVNWLVCNDVCIPQQVELGLALPVLPASAPAGRGRLRADAVRSTLPVELPSPARAETTGKKITLHITSPEFRTARIEDIWFFADQQGRTVPGAKQTYRIDGDSLELGLHAGDAPAAPGERLTGVLAVKERAAAGIAVRGYNINAVLAEGVPSMDAPASSPDAATSYNPTLPLALLLALLGGMVLNLMPCVFPVLSIKALSLLNQAQEAPLAARLHGLAYTLGVLASFALLGAALIALKASGTQVGWGFQFQSPRFVLAIAYLMFAVGLNLSGVFELGASLAGIGSSLAARTGYSGSFFTGVLAAVVATPCTAPFMGSAVGFALSQPPAVLIAVLLCMGLGLALPYLLLSIWPALQRRLPRPGGWMERVRQGLAFPMYAAAVWLVWVLAQQTGLNAVAVALAGMVAIAFAAWIYGATRAVRHSRRRIGSITAALTLAAVMAASFTSINAGTADLATRISASAEKNWEPYSAERLRSARAKGEPVFLNLTAAWCITCLVNERVALNDRTVADTFNKAGITYLKGDWTNQDQDITKLLAQFGRSGVPLYVYYPAGETARPVVLPQLLTPEIVLGTVNAPAAIPPSAALAPTPQTN